METYEEWHEKTYGVMPDPWQPYNAWQVKFTAYIASKPNPFKNLDKERIQALFDKATAGVIAQGKPSFLGKNIYDSSVAYYSVHDNKIRCCPIGFILSNEQVKKYGINPSKFICSFESELIQELVPNSGEVCIRHFLGKLQKAHTDAWFTFKRSKEKSDFIVDYIANSNVVAKYFGLKEIKNGS